MKNKLKDKTYKSIYFKQNMNSFARIKELVITGWATKSIAFSKKKYLNGVDLTEWINNSKPQKFSIDPLITWIGQSSFLLQVDNINILFDPLFGDMNFLYKRNLPPGIAIKDLPKIDFILVSHNHNDHMDFKSLLKLKHHYSSILIPVGKKTWFDDNGFVDVIENEWWQESIFEVNNKKIKIYFLPAVHWAGRSVFDINKSLWGSWLINIGDKIFYFAGDTVYDNHFKEIRKKFGKIDVAFLPIAPNEPKELVSMSHISAFQSVDAFIDLDAKHFIPMHWGTFRLGLDKFYDPILKLSKAWLDKKELLKNKQLHILKFGQKLKI